MISLMMAAVVISGIDTRPADVLGTDGQAGYVAKLQQKLESPPFVNLLATAIPDCPSLTYSSSGYLQLHNSDFGPTDAFYKTVAKEPAVIEHVLVSGCGKTLQVNLMALRLLSAPDDLKFTFHIVGKTTAGPLLQRDAYQYVTIATDSAETLAGHKSSCGRVAMIYDTRVVTPPNGNAPWKEIWSVSKCDFKARIAVDFTPTADGGTDISAHALKSEE
jgi:hypothetical protein